MTTKSLYKYSGTVLRVVDGDGCVAMVDLGMKVYKQVVIRLANINAPELTSKDPVIKAAAVASKDYLTSLIGGKTIYFDSKSLDKYDRSIAEIFLEKATVSINTIMVEKGYAVKQKY
jgi:endonuclease YncB( thermonuclease family)